MAPPRSRGGWDSGRWDYPPPSRPLPADGIKAKSQRGRIGDTWWSQRFVAVLESFDMGARLHRGRRYARAGQVLDLEVGPGRVTASVQGSRAKPYRVLIGVDVLAEGDWARVEEAMSAKAVFLAKLLAGEMPQNVEDAFTDCKLSLFPRSRGDLDTACSCPDSANPCKHVAATYYLLAEAFDTDPFLIFTWRGRANDVLLDRLRARRGASTARGATDGDDDGDDWPSCDDDPLDAAVDRGRFWAAGPELVDIRARPRRAAVPDAVLRLLDAVDVVVRGRSLVEVLGPAYERMTTAAFEQATGDESQQAKAST
jgi:uncharacterized Zn finger protein